MSPRTPHSAAGLLAVLAVAAGTFFAGAGSALAPEPAKLSSRLPVSGATAAIYVNTSTPTTVVFWGSSWTVASNGPAAGTPCSSSALAADAITSQAIQTFVTSGGFTYRRCA
jgi:hypothetical protein